MRSGANPNVSKEGLFSAIVIAALKCPPDIVAILLEAGADPNVVGMNDVGSLAMAAHKGDAESVKLLVDAGAKVNASESDGSTPLDWSGLQRVLRSRAAASEGRMRP